MPALTRIAALLTVISGCAWAVLALQFDFPHADGDGGFLGPGPLLALLFGGAPVLTGIEVLRRDRRLSVR